ncbi:hypothetical protein PPTG_20771 [Phytophthora nicotianae INRA-310]|uniref:Uncharacterized protein n=1 Tax=Phytophthora nicotianae (strain INRA-310) TaxID=761204 RepID=W2RFT4_PHYN3|nr:hypothetical protein PPTG_20771 [Phytophthora nicotianae INRA-310]ETN24252.1 hypothetical protein PPTG_20771 [Phytophthora nicotianae INRA-310]
MAQSFRYTIDPPGHDPLLKPPQRNNHTPSRSRSTTYLARSLKSIHATPPQPSRVPPRRDQPRPSLSSSPPEECSKITSASSIGVKRGTSDVASVERPDGRKAAKAANAKSKGNQRSTAVHSIGGEDHLSYNKAKSWKHLSVRSMHHTWQD